MLSNDRIFDAIISNLQTGGALINDISDAQFTDVSVPPYFSGIGCHMRHILDIFDCIFTGLDAGKVNLAARERCIEVETNRDICLAYLDRIILRLEACRQTDLDRVIDVTDDLGVGLVTCRYTVAAALCQAHSHAIHHFAALGYVTTSLGIEMPASGFGFNPTTPREIPAAGPN